MSFCHKDENKVKACFFAKADKKTKIDIFLEKFEEMGTIKTSLLAT